MTKLVNLKKVDLTVFDGDVKVTIKPGDSAEVDGRRDWSDNLFVKAGYLQIQEEKKQQKQKTEK